MLQSVLEPIFPPPQFPTQYSAMGYLLGRFEALPDEKVQYVIRGQLYLNDELAFKASMRLREWLKLSQQPSFQSDGEHLWRIYFRTNEAGKLTQVQLIKCIPIDQTTKQSDANQVETAVDFFRIRGRIASSDDQKIVLRLERNDRPPSPAQNSSQWQPFFLTVWGSQQNANRGQFWDLLCIRNGKRLRLQQATLVDEGRDLQETTNDNPVDSPRQEEQSLSSSTNTIMIRGKQPEITIKFTTRPDLPSQSKKVMLQVTGENGVVVKAELNRKTLQKQIEKMDSYADWVAVLSGKIAQVTSEGIVELESAGINVFEKKQKVAQPEEIDSQTSSQEAGEI